MRLGLELTPPGASGDGPWDQWCEAAAKAEASGFDSLWLAGDRDAATLAGALAAVTTSVTLGVIAGVGPRERNPSVLARDVTAVDVLAAGRAALVLEGPGPLASEGARVCRLLFAGGEAHHDGPHFRLDGAVNRPPPVGSPSVLIQSPEPPEGAEADGWVTTVGPDQLAGWRRKAGNTTLLWRGSLAGEAQVLAAALFERGVDGLIVRCPASAAEVASLARQLL